MKEYFRVHANRYIDGKDFDVVRPASLNNPKDHAVMFITVPNLSKAAVFEEVENCLVFWPSAADVPESMEAKHAVVRCEKPHSAYCRFFAENGITNYPQREELQYIDGAFVAKGAQIGRHVTIMPGVYIGADCIIGDNVYIGIGAKILDETMIGNDVVIRENAVIGSDSLTTDRDKDGKAITMPQFGKVVLEDGVQIGTGTVINRAAIDETIIRRGAKISGSCYISHNVEIGENAFIVGETMILGSARIGRNCLISGNCTVNVGVQVGEGTTIGMGSVVTRDIPERVIAYGIPAKVAKSKE